MAIDPSNKDSAEKLALPEVPKGLSKITAWWKVAEIISYLLMFLAPLSCLFGNWLPEALSNKLFSLFIGLLLLCIAFIIQQWFWNANKRTTDIIAALRECGRPYSKEERSSVASYIEAIDRRHRCGFIASIVLGVILFFVVVWQPVAHKFRKEVPSVVAIREAKYFDPTQEKELLERAPFLDALRGCLATEGEAAKEKYKVILFETYPFSNPTHAFPLTISPAEKEWFSVTGYAFRVRSDSPELAYEPIGADLSQDDVVVLNIPPSESGDRIFGILRISLADMQRPFPDNLKNQIKATTPRTPKGERSQ